MVSGELLPIVSREWGSQSSDNNRGTMGDGLSSSGTMGMTGNMVELTWYYGNGEQGNYEEV